MGTVRDLHDFLEEAELLHYYSAICNQLRISTVPQLKYVEEDDLAGIGMSKPEMRRLKKLYKKECPHGALGKIKKVKGSTKQVLFTFLWVQWEPVKITLQKQSTCTELTTANRCNQVTFWYHVGNKSRGLGCSMENLSKYTALYFKYFDPILT